MTGNIVRPGSGRAKGCQSSAGRTFVVSQGQQPHERIAAALTEQDQRQRCGGSGRGTGTTQRFLLKVKDESGLHLAGFHFVDRGVDVLETAPLVDHVGLACRVQFDPTS